jgi:hypothetical protein
MPKKNPWPKSDEASLQRFYGDPGDESNLVKFTFPPGFLLYGETPISTHRCHKKVKESLETILSKIGQYVQDYDGCFNFRKMRGGSLYSLHARGAAIDLCASTNGNKTHWPTAATMPLEVMEEFSREGWLCAGAFWSRDAMHSQATQ